jgi:hypothetical protein
MSLVASLLVGLFGLSGFTLFLGCIAASFGGQTDTALLFFEGTGGCIAAAWLICLSRERSAGRRTVVRRDS